MARPVPFERITAAEARVLLAKAASRKKGHKYGAKAEVVDGHYFPSHLEAARYGQLKLAERAGAITDLKLQVPFPLTCEGETIGTYVSDFAYVENGKRVVEDAKGVRLPLYKLKLKWFRVLYPQIEFREITSPRGKQWKAPHSKTASARMSAHKGLARSLS